ncbi:glycosyltransferase [Lactiplantibacillus plantarum]|uniref:glycosyltransferase n=1 Tax=Lactiplantibacillus plantarum TaxID=1590 RepID=UPI003EBF8A5B
MTKVRVRIVMQNLKFGGAEKTLCTFLQNFNREKFEIELILHTKEGLLLKEIPTDVKVRGVVPVDDGSLIHKIRRSFFFKLLKKFPRMLIKTNSIFSEKCDLTVAYMEGISTELASLFEGPKIAWIHTDMAKNPWADKFYSSIDKEEQTYTQFNRVVFVSAGSKESFINKFSKVNQLKEVILHNPIDEVDVTRKSKEKSIDVTEWLKVTNDTYRIITVGRLDPIKRIDLLIKSFIKLKKIQPNVSLTIIGDGSELKKLKKLANIYLDNGIYFTGFKSNPQAYVGNSELFVSTSLVESYPTAIIEAILLKKAVIATNNIGVREVFGNYEYAGVVTENITSDELTQFIRRVEKDSINLNTTINRISLSFRLKVIINQYEKLFLNVIGEQNG